MTPLVSTIISGDLTAISTRFSLTFIRLNLPTVSMMRSLSVLSAMIVTAEADWTHCMIEFSFHRSLKRLSILWRTDQSFLAVTMQVFVLISSLLSLRMRRMFISCSEVVPSLEA